MTCWLSIAAFDMGPSAFGEQIGPSGDAQVPCRWSALIGLHWQRKRFRSAASKDRRIRSVMSLVFSKATAMGGAITSR